VNHSALLADITFDSNERAKYNMYSAFCAALGSFTSFFGHLYWDKADLRAFRAFALVLAAFSWGCFEFTAHVLAQPGRMGAARMITEDEWEVVQPGRMGAPRQGAGGFAEGGGGAGIELLKMGQVGDGGRSKAGGFGDSQQQQQQQVGIHAFARQVWQHRNLKAFCAMYALQQFDCAFGKNFFPIFLERLVGDALAPATRSLVVSASFILPWVGTIYLTAFVRAAGISAAVSFVLTARAALLGMALPVLLLAGGGGGGGSFSGWPCALLLLTNRVVSEAMCRLLPLVQTDLVDEDMYLHKRETSMSASIIGTIGFFGKPSQSLAPMAGFALLAGIVSPDEEADAGGTGAGGQQGAAGGQQLLALTGQQRSTMQWTFLLLPMCVVLLQQLLWHGAFSLRGPYLAVVKNYIRDMLDVSRSV
jgi:Na+/melibiose symporter-like transporter